MAIWSSTAAPHPSGNDAFDAYRQGELDHLEEQGKEFQAFLDRLRLARDKEEFDGFMAEQRKAVVTRLPSKQGGA